MEHLATPTPKLIKPALQYHPPPPTSLITPIQPKNPPIQSQKSQNPPPSLSTKPTTSTTKNPATIINTIPSHYHAQINHNPHAHINTETHKSIATPSESITNPSKSIAIRSEIKRKEVLRWVSSLKRREKNEVERKRNEIMREREREEREEVSDNKKLIFIIQSCYSTILYIGWYYSIIYRMVL